MFVMLGQVLLVVSTYRRRFARERARWFAVLRLKNQIVE
jgi:hypothetical protein